MGTKRFDRPRPKGTTNSDNRESDGDGLGPGSPDAECASTKSHATSGSGVTHFSSEESADSKEDKSATWQRPSGETDDQYKGWLNWAKARWAWEFLRRSEAFQRACQQEHRNEPQLAEDFGLQNFKDYRKGHLAKPVTKFQISVASYPSRETIRSRSGKEVVKATTLNIRLGPAEVLFKFNLRLHAMASSQALNREIEDVKKRLYEFRELFLKSGAIKLMGRGDSKSKGRAESKDKGGPGSKGMHMKRIPRRDLLDALRYLDLKKFDSRLDDRQIWEQVCSDRLDFGHRRSVTTKSLNERAEVLSVRANELAAFHYLALALVGPAP